MKKKRTTIKDLQKEIEGLKVKPSGGVKITIPTDKRFELGLELAKAISKVADIAKTPTNINASFIGCTAMHSNENAFSIGESQTAKEVAKFKMEDL